MKKWENAYTHTCLNIFIQQYCSNNRRGSVAFGVSPCESPEPLGFEFLFLLGDEISAEKVCRIAIGDRTADFAFSITVYFEFWITVVVCKVFDPS